MLEVIRILVPLFLLGLSPIWIPACVEVVGRINDRRRLREQQRATETES